MSLRVHRYTVAKYLVELERELLEVEGRLAASWAELYWSDRRYLPLGGVKL